MKTVSLFRVNDGKLIGQTLCVPDADIALNTPEGHDVVEGDFDHMSHSIDLDVHAEIVAARAEVAEVVLPTVAIDVASTEEQSATRIALTEFRQQRLADIDELKQRLIVKAKSSQTSQVVICGVVQSLSESIELPGK